MQYNTNTSNISMQFKTVFNVMQDNIQCNTIQYKQYFNAMQGNIQYNTIQINAKFQHQLKSLAAIAVHSAS